ncbi:MAG: cytosine permease [Candidatus Aminicenantaceae bacterium]
MTNSRRNSSEILEDFSLQAVPLEKRRSWVNLAVVWIGIAVVMSAIFRGMMVGMGLGKIPSVLLSYLLGEVLLIAMMAFTGFIGAKTGLSTPLIANLSFGRSGSLLISISIALSLIGWFGVQAALFARTVQFFFDLNLYLPYLSLLCGLIMVIPAIFGIRGLSTLSWLASPFLMVIFIIGVVKIGFDSLPAEVLRGLALAHSPDPYPLTIGESASIVAGGFIVGATTSSDIFRYAKPRLREIFLAATIAMSVSAFLHVVGSVLSMSFGLYHEKLPELIISENYLGFGLTGFIALLLAQWTTNDSNIYSAVLALNNIFRWKRWKLTIIAGIFSSLLASLGILERLELFLILLTVSIGPIGGILLADYYLLGRLKKEKFEQNKPKILNVKALIAYIISVAVGWATSGHPLHIRLYPFSIFAFNGILCSVILYYLMMKLFPEKGKNHAVND